MESRQDTTPTRVPVRTPQDEQEEEERHRLEDESRRLEMKRRKGTSEGRSKKKRRLEKLTGWGEETGVERQEICTIEEVTEVGREEKKESIIEK